MRQILRTYNENKSVQILMVIFYAYLALLPLLSVFALYFDKDVWTGYTTVFDHISHTLTFFYHFYSLILLGYSGVAMAMVISNIPVPKNVFWILVLILDPVLTFIYSFFTGHHVRFADIFFFTFVFDNAALIIAGSILYFTLKDKFIILILMFSGGVMISYFGIYIFDSLKSADLKNLLSVFVNLGFSAYAFYKVLAFKTKTDKKASPIQGKFFIISTLIGGFVVFFLIIVYILPVLAFFNH